MSLDHKDLPPRKIVIKSKPSKSLEPTTDQRSTRNQEIFDRTRREAHQRRLEFIERLEQRLLARQQPSIHLAEQPWENQLTNLNPNQPLWTCVPVSFINALKKLGIYDPREDNEQHVVHEVEDLFVSGGIQTQPALQRLTEARSARNLRLQNVRFEEAIQSLREGNVVLYGSGAHMRLLTNVGAYFIGEGVNRRLSIGVKEVDPMGLQPRAEVKPIRDILPREAGADDTTYITLKVQRPTVRLPGRR